MAFDKFALLGCAAVVLMSSGCPGSATGGVSLRPDGHSRTGEVPG